MSGCSSKAVIYEDQVIVYALENRSFSHVIGSSSRRSKASSISKWGASCVSVESSWGGVKLILNLEN